MKNIITENKKRYNFLDLTAIVMSGVISIPALMIGFILTKKYGFIAANLAIIIGNIIFIARPIALASQRCKKNSSEMTESILGTYGAKISALALMIVLAGWFAINLRILSDLLTNQNKMLVNSLIGLTICFFVTGGIERIRVISKYVIIFFALSVTLTLIYFLENGNNGFNSDNTNHYIFYKEALLIIIGSSFALIFKITLKLTNLGEQK